MHYDAAGMRMSAIQHRRTRIAFGSITMYSYHVILITSRVLSTPLDPS